MIYSIYPTNDATLYEYSSTQNTGLDSIIEISKNVDYNTASRIVLKFNILHTSASAYYLRLQQSEIAECPISYSIAIHPLSASWYNGTGRFNDTPIISNGVSWEYSTDVNKWQTGSYESNYTGSYSVTAGGGVWDYTLVASQSFNYEYGDVYANVTNIVNNWNSGSINNGFIIKFPENFEYTDNNINTSLKFYSKESHTIFQPRLDACWDDSVFNTGSLLPLINNNVEVADISIYLPNLKSNYTLGSVNKVKIAARERYPLKTFATSSEYNSVNYLPSNTLYSIIDLQSNFTVIPFSDNYTKISCDSTGNYFNLYTANLLANRPYKLIFAIGDNYFDNNFIFNING